MESWYVLHCKPREVERAEWHLQNQGFTTFCPRWKVQKRVRGKRQVAVEPLFPSYLFIQVDLAKDNYTSLRSTRGVNGFVRFGGQPAQVPASVISDIERRTSASTLEEGTTGAAGLYAKGTPVEILNGPFAGLKGLYDIADGESRCFVLLEMLGKAQRLELDEGDIIPS
ncbi:transcription/translation regulatory transformer protein RfaH [Aliidiomarina iranensis]|uniref:Transcription antitermination protein RfaH n=1 Tax=Aliidiomarina iranensis TaxID=1434071 RepID=A0A432VT85_9GAMM|nr:transcription/translation regulatory transformer protein RfaH [Aliidiomarina iranensis]RUO19639.1 transcription/translation regulatory transformer protein RfaH [Aliidiomarina iranensis]